MISKTFEVRDRATFIPVMAVKLSPACEKDRYLLARAGFGRDHLAQAEFIQLIRFNNGRSAYDPFDWNDRTMQTAHDYIAREFSNLESGAVIDVEFILGETNQPKASEQYGDAT